MGRSSSRRLMARGVSGDRLAGGVLVADVWFSSGEEEEGDEEEEEDEEEGEYESPTRGRKKRTASSSLEEDSPKRGRTHIPEASTTATNSSPEWDPRAQPLVNS